jgi:hypothetical protein
MNPGAGKTGVKKCRAPKGPAIIVGAGRPTITFQRGTAEREQLAIWEDSKSPTQRKKYATAPAA